MSCWAVPAEIGAFLALQIRQARGQLAIERKALTQRGRLIWSYNFGFPAASLDHDILRRRYEHCVLAALSLADDQVDVTVVTLRAALQRAAHDTVAQLERARAQLVPEIAAAVAGFAQSALLDDSLDALVDVGGVEQLIAVRSTCSRQKTAVFGGFGCPAPDGLDHALCDDSEVDRLAVAIGLSLPAMDIPEITLPNAIEDSVTRPRRDADDRYVGKEWT